MIQFLKHFKELSECDEMESLILKSIFLIQNFILDDSKFELNLSRTTKLELIQKFEESKQFTCLNEWLIEES
jgi:hypothetical protein